MILLWFYITIMILDHYYIYEISLSLLDQWYISWYSHQSLPRLRSPVTCARAWKVQEEKLRSLRTLQDFGSTFSPIRGYVNMAIWLSVWIKTGCESMISISISISITVELWFLWCQTQKKWRKSSNPPSFVGFKHVKTLKLHHLVGGDWNMNGLFSIYGMSSETHWQADIFQDG